jgi:hypothetical protein
MNKHSSIRVIVIPPSLFHSDLQELRKEDEVRWLGEGRGLIRPNPPKPQHQYQSLEAGVILVLIVYPSQGLVPNLSKG